MLLRVTGKTVLPLLFVEEMVTILPEGYRDWGKGGLLEDEINLVKVFLPQRERTGGLALFQVTARSLGIRQFWHFNAWL